MALAFMPRSLCYICEATQGGVRKHLRDLFEHFTREDTGFHVHAILGDRGEAGFHEELAAFARTGRFTPHIVPQMRRAIRPWRDFSAYTAVKELLRETKADVVHTHSSKGGFIGRNAAHLLGISHVIHTPHVFPFQWTHGLSARLYLALERHVAAYTRTLVCVGDGQREDALARNLCAPGKLVVIRNGIRIPPAITPADRAAARAALGADADVPLIGMVARLAPQKGVGNFVRAAAQVLKASPRARFVVVGGPTGGPGEAEVRRRMDEYAVPAAAFQLAGHRPDAEALYAAFDIVALSSLYEGLPYVLLEAMSRGLPVVATDVLGSRDVVLQGETGFLAPVNEPRHIAERLLTLLNDPVLRGRMGAAAREHVRHAYSFDAFLRGHEQLYQEDFLKLNAGTPARSL